jgi:hypothetical protein
MHGIRGRVHPSSTTNGAQLLGMLRHDSLQSSERCQTAPILVYDHSGDVY